MTPRPLTDEELDELLGDTDKLMRQAWAVAFSTPRRRPPRPGDAALGAAHGIDPGDTGGYSGMVLLQAIDDLLVEVTAHLGREGELITARALDYLEVARESLRKPDLDRDRVLALVEAFSVDERRLRAMIELDYAASTCSHTRASLDKLRTAIGHLSRQLLARTGHPDAVQH
ncbi:hypothetical protein ACFOVU_23385 [Nocardiopsis sediminis]|uniref:Uncharacterized protein n=1 Tax=Nocardiopsis sediminis TaxID=1778267 RepID=A0ABV8FTZ5_9ACTN